MQDGDLVGVVVLAVPPVRGAGHGEEDALTVVDLIEVEHLVVGLEDIVAGEGLPADSHFPHQIRGGGAEQPIAVLLLQMLLPLDFASLPPALAPHPPHEALHRLVDALLFVPG